MLKIKIFFKKTIDFLFHDKLIAILIALAILILLINLR